MDEYSMASDGSNQVKVSLRCPMCRVPYRTSSQSTGTSSATNGFDTSLSSSTDIARAILQLRTAASISIPSYIISAAASGRNAVTDEDCYPSANNDSELTASALAQRSRFLQQLHWKDLKDAVVLVQQYFDTIEEKDCGTVPPLNWELWKLYIEHYQNQQQQSAIRPSSSNLSEDSKGIPDIGATVLSRDPTLFLGGLDELLNPDEQEYITRMLVSGVAETVAQAAYILHSMVDVATKTSSPATNQRNRVANKKSIAQLEHEKKVRQRFPLPTHMPRVVSIPPYNPLDGNPKQVPLKFAVPSTKSSSNRSRNSAAPAADATPLPALVVAHVQGIAGRVGLRRGDTVTHVNGDRVTTFSEYTIALQYAYSDASVLITVNANEAVAQQLLQRSQQMKEQNIRFHG
jgi:hypothetical protein